MRVFLFVAASALAMTAHILCSLVRTGRDEPDELYREVEGSQVQIRKLRRGLETQETAGPAL